MCRSQTGSRQIVRDRPQTAVVILTASNDPQEREGAIAAGAIAAVTKDADPQELLDAIHRQTARDENS